MEPTADVEVSHRVPRLVLIVLLLLVLWLSFRIIRPYLDPILLAVILAPMVHPVFRWLRVRLGGRPTPAAVLTCVLVVVVLLGPVVLLGTALVRQGVESFQGMQKWVTDGNLQQALDTHALDRVKDLVERAVPALDLDRIDLEGLILDGSRKAASFLISKGGTLLGQAGLLLGKLLLMLFVLFYMVRDGEAILTSALHLLPLRQSQEERLLQRIRAVSRSAILGAFGTAAAQGVAGGIGLAVVGIPPLFWGTMMAFASLIPVVGTTLVWGPAAVYLLLMGSWGKALFLVLYCATVVGSIDNFLRPVLMSGQARMGTLWLFLAILGGIQAFGLLGLIYGPLVFGLLAVLLYLYQEEFSGFLEQQDAT